MKNELIVARKAEGLRDETKSILIPFSDVDISSELNVVMRREDLENTLDYRHYISYVSVWNDKGEVLVYRRTKKSGEETLVGQASIGFGGM